MPNVRDIDYSLGFGRHGSNYPFEVIQTRGLLRFEKPYREDHTFKFHEY